MGHTITPEHVTHLAADEVFVFGSNAKGRHLGGAARTAWLKFGAKFGKGTGHHGQSYAINSMSGLPTLEQQVREFLAYATEHPELTFLLTPIGTGIAGLTAEQVAPLFRNAPPNITLPESFASIIN
ncbi:hypothetical protein AOZ07_01435 [Glutamicibacter halophytocola]|uniref:A1S_2505 family phage non-structural protein n=1 Tax=Glutamicibacter halophytocola TaxID=1933880 RepID=UPI0006D4B6B8|nr:hypothetical protein [Glutamicibacter halophytocola]ALG27791.1 hypothetical protein AOZ07_01435 [Glutamicibacter halophytocola]